MSYELFQFNCGKDAAQGYVLAGRGEHEGTNCSISPREMTDMIGRARSEAMLRGHKVAEFTLMIGDSQRGDGPEVKAMVAEMLDLRFQCAHAERMMAPAMIDAALSPSPADPR